MDKTDAEWKEGFRKRLKIARGNRTLEVMGELLDIPPNTYSKYEGSRATVMPVRLLPLFCKICGVSLEWLLKGDKVKQTRQSAKKRRASI